MMTATLVSGSVQDATEKVFHRLLPDDKVFIEEESTIVKLYLVGLKCLMVVCVIVFLIVGILFVFLERAPHDKIILIRDMFQDRTNTSEE